MDSTQTTLRHVSHCFGYGGIDLALKRIFGRRIVTISACEIEAYCVANALSKSEAGLLDVDIPFWTDLKSFPFGQFHGLVDIYSSGFPCQPFSCAGKQEADNDPRHLWPHIRDGIARMQPDYIFLENVRAIITSKLKGKGWADPEGTPVLLHVLRELERIGYECEWGIFSASEIGATHRRQRVFILGRRRGANQLADASGIGSGLYENGFRKSEKGREGAQPGSEELALSAGERSRETRQLQRGCEERVARTSGTLADTRCPERRPLSIAGSESEQGNEFGRNQIAGGAGECGEILADASSLPINPGANGIGRAQGTNVDWRSARAAMGDTQSHDERRAPESSMHREREQVGGSGSDVGNSESIGRREGQSESEFRERRDSARESGGAMVNPESEREREQNNETRSQSRSESRENSGGGCDGVSFGVGLADSERTGLEIGRCFSGNDGSKQQTVERGCLPAFPPGPKDFEGWARVLAIRPDLAPATAKRSFRGMADEHSPKLDAIEYRVDRLRACGNGVVPATAAKAFVTLYMKFETHLPTH